MAKKKKHEEHEEHANHERWMLSYADILTLLLALFIVMFAISKVDQKKFEQFAQGTASSFGQANLALQGQTGSLDGRDGILPDQKPGQEDNVPADEPLANSPMAQQALQREKARAAQADTEKANLEKLKAQLQAQLNAKKLGNAVQFQLDERGLVVNIVTDRVLFDNGAAVLRPEGAKVLDAIAPMVKGLPNTMTVEGHTDNVPISGAFRSNWELSTARATNVLARLLADGVQPGHVSAAGYADQKPLAANATDSGRARNRRVAIVVLPTVDLGAKSPGSPATPNVAPTAPSVAPAPPDVAPAAANAAAAH